MLTEDRELIESLVSDGDSNRDANDLGAAKISYLKALDEFERIEKDGISETSDEDKKLKQRILENIAAIDVKLAVKHKEQGMAALESGDYALAIEELEAAIELASDEDVRFLEECKKHLDVARVKERDRKVKQAVTPYVTRGDEFREEGNYAEAVLEYSEAQKLLAGFPPNHRYVVYVTNALKDCRRSLIRPYLRSIYNAVSEGKYKKAYSILQRVFLLVYEKDFVYRAFFERMKEDILKNLSREEIEEEEVDTPEEWAKAIKDYEEALELYTSYTDVDPLGPAYTSGNIYEDRFIQSRRKLAILYRQRGDRLRDQANIRKAIKNYKEALKLFPRSDKGFHDTFREMKKLRAQLTHKAG